MEPQIPKETARTLKIQHVALYSRVSGHVSSCTCKKRSCQRVASVRICMGRINSRMTRPAQGPNTRTLIFLHVVTFGRQCVQLHTSTGRLHIPTRASRQTFWVARVFFLMWLCGARVKCTNAFCQKSGSTTLKGRSQATGKWGFYFVQIKHRGWLPPRVCTCACSFSREQIPWFSKRPVHL